MLRAQFFSVVNIFLIISGFLKSSKERIAIAMLPNGESLMIKEGDVLGKEQARVEKIEENKILFKRNT